MSKTNNSITLKDLAVLVKENKEKFVKKMGLIIPPQILDIVIKMGESHRYENIVVRNYESEICVSQEIQFTVFIQQTHPTVVYLLWRLWDTKLAGWHSMRALQEVRILF